MTGLEKAKHEYLIGDVIMSELLRHDDFKGLTIEEKLELLKWSGDDEFMTINYDGEIVTK